MYYSKIHPQTDLEVKQRNRKVIEERMKKLAILRLAQKTKQENAENNQADIMAAEKVQLNAAMSSNSLDPSQVYQIISKRHAAEIKTLEANFLANLQISNIEKEKEIRFSREVHRALIKDSEDLANFDKETEVLIANSIDNISVRLFNLFSRIKFIIRNLTNSTIMLFQNLESRSKL